MLLKPNRTILGGMPRKLLYNSWNEHNTDKSLIRVNKGAKASGCKTWVTKLRSVLRRLDNTWMSAKLTRTRRSTYRPTFPWSIHRQLHCARMRCTHVQTVRVQVMWMLLRCTLHGLQDTTTSLPYNSSNSNWTWYCHALSPLLAPLSTRLVQLHALCTDQRTTTRDYRPFKLLGWINKSSLPPLWQAAAPPFMQSRPSP